MKAPIGGSLKVPLRGGLKAPVAGGVRAGLALVLGFGVVQVASSVGHTLDLRSAEPLVNAPAGESLTAGVELACPGASLTGIKGVPDVKVTSKVAAAAAPKRLLPSDLPETGEASITPQSGSPTALEARPAVTRAQAPSSGAIFVSGSGGGAPGLAAAQEFASSTKNLRGLATIACQPPQAQSWLLGGGDGSGRQERLILANPGANPVTGTVTVFGDEGTVGEPQSVSVPGQSSVALLVDAVAASSAHPVIHVSADGSGLAASLTQTWLDGTDARGADLVGPAAPPAKKVVIPVTAPGGNVALRLAATGTSEAVARIDVLGPKGLVPNAGAEVTRVKAGATAQVELKGVSKDAVAVVVSADAPIVAAVVTDTGSDIAWSAGSAALTAPAGLPLPDTAGVKRTLNVVSPGSAATVEVVLVTGSKVTSSTTKIGADSVAQIDLGDADALWVRPTSGSGVRAGVVSTSEDGGVSALPLRDAAVTSSFARVFPLP